VLRSAHAYVQVAVIDLAARALEAGVGCPIPVGGGRAGDAGIGRGELRGIWRAEAEGRGAAVEEERLGVGESAAMGKGQGVCECEAKSED
jgi:hypothetical protein